ncbi:MAG: c-type cytochrome [Nitrospinota bacterium]
MKPRVRMELLKALILLGLLGATVIVLTPTDWKAEGTIPTGVRGPESPQYAEWLYTTNCVGCHGYDGKGRGWLAWTMFVKVPMPDFTNTTLMAAKTDAQLYHAIAEGMRRGPQRTMRGFGQFLSSEDIRRTVAYIRSFAPSPPPRPQAEEEKP